MLDAMEVPMDYEGPKLEIHIRDTKNDNSIDLLGAMFSNIPKSPAKIGLFQKDKVDGDITKKALEYLKDRGHVLVELKDFMDIVNEIKIEREVDNLKTASKFTQFTFSKVVNEVEDIIDGEK